MPLTIANPDTALKGGLVLLQEAFGITDHIRDLAERLASEGWLTVAPHLFHRTGDPVIAYDDIPGVMPHIDALSADGVLRDVDEGLDHLRASGLQPNQIGVMGMCMGGTIAAVVAARRDVGAAVTLYGGGVSDGRFGFAPLVEEAPGIRAPWLGLYADLDVTISVTEIEELRRAASRSSSPTELIRYPDAGHGFLCDMRSDYHAESAADAWGRALAWFDRYLQNA